MKREEKISSLSKSELAKRVGGTKVLFFCKYIQVQVTLFMQSLYITSHERGCYYT